MLWNFNYREPVTKNRIVISLGIKGEVLTFHIKACIELMPPIHRLPSGQ